MLGFLFSVFSFLHKGNNSRSEVNIIPPPKKTSPLSVCLVLLCSFYFTVYFFFVMVRLARFAAGHVIPLTTYRVNLFPVIAFEPSLIHTFYS